MKNAVRATKFVFTAKIFQAWSQKILFIREYGDGNFVLLLNLDTEDPFVHESVSRNLFYS
jgi:hypothetical protein